MNTRILVKLQKALDFTKEMTGVVQEVLNEYTNKEFSNKECSNSNDNIEYVFNNMDKFDRKYVEQIVSSSAVFALKYAQKIQDRFEKGEDAIIQKSEVCLEYVRFLLSLNKDIPASIMNAMRTHYGNIF